MLAAFVAPGCHGAAAVDHSQQLLRRDRGGEAERGVLVPGLGVSSNTRQTVLAAEFMENSRPIMALAASGLEAEGHNLARRGIRTKNGEESLDYALRFVRSGRYCSDNGRDPVRCASTNLGVYEAFSIFHWSNLPHLHVLKGGKDQKWCRDHGNHVSCNQDMITTTEEFQVFSLGADKVALKGHEKDKWCTAEGDRLQCLEDERSDDIAFMVIPFPGNSE